MVENGYTEYNTAAALQRGQMIDIYIFSFCFVPPLTTSIMPPYMIYAGLHIPRNLRTDKYLFSVDIQISLFVVGEADLQYVK